MFAGELGNVTLPRRAPEGYARRGDGGGMATDSGRECQEKRLELGHVLKNPRKERWILGVEANLGWADAGEGQEPAHAFRILSEERKCLNGKGFRCIALHNYRFAIRSRLPFRNTSGLACLQAQVRPKCGTTRHSNGHCLVQRRVGAMLRSMAAQDGLSAFRWARRRNLSMGYSGMQPEEGPGMSKTVLIVEDNELNMKLFQDLLQAHGYQTVGTRSGIETLDLARSHRPDLILMDIQLPEVSGLEVTKWLKDDPELRSIPVIAVTAFAMKGDEERIREGGCEAYLSKPISVSKFLETVRNYIGA